MCVCCQEDSPDFRESSAAAVNAYLCIPCGAAQFAVTGGKPLPIDKAFWASVRVDIQKNNAGALIPSKAIAAALADPKNASTVALVVNASASVVAGRVGAAQNGIVG